MTWAMSFRDQLAELHVDHQIYLRLDEPIGNNEVLHLSGPMGFEVDVPFSDKYLETPVIQVNQVGYSPRATETWAYVSAWMGDGGALAATDMPNTANVIFDPIESLAPRTSVLSGLQVSLRSANDTDMAGPVKQINLADLPQAEGAFYRVQLPGKGSSWPTQVSETAVFKAFFTVMRGLTHNRWGRDLTGDWTEWSSRPPDHQNIFTGDFEGYREFYPETQPQTGARSFQGGHHDAGDFDIQIIHTVLPMMLLRAFEVNYASLTDGQLIIPESGNGIPDVLDEALWNIQGWEQLQDPDGGVRMGGGNLSAIPWASISPTRMNCPTGPTARTPFIPCAARGSSPRRRASSPPLMPPVARRCWSGPYAPMTTRWPRASARRTRAPCFTVRANSTG